LTPRNIRVLSYVVQHVTNWKETKVSSETYSWLAKNVLAGFSDTRRPWWATVAENEGHDLNLYPGAVPMERVYELIASWTPIEEGVYSADMEEVPTHKLIRASDTKEIISVVGKDRATHSYRDWLVGTVQECVGEQAQVSSAGLLKRRAQAWVQIERPETAVGPDGILFSPYVSLSTSLDSSLSTQINENTQMTICDNTLRITRGQGLAFKHTKNSNAKLGDYRSIMSAIMRGESEFRKELERQLAVKVSDDDFDRFLEFYVPVEDGDAPAKKTRSNRKRQEITNLYRNDPRVIRWEGTEFGVVQAVNTWNTHMSQLHNSTGIEMDDTNLRSMKLYSQRLRTPKGDSPDQEAVKLLESVLA
jgi:phage/plasmid-like protein (TIGR03299 family)